MREYIVVSQLVFVSFYISWAEKFKVWSFWN